MTQIELSPSFTGAPSSGVSTGVAISTHEITDIDAKYRDAPSDKPWVAPELHKLVFARGQNTYFIVDAALRSEVTGSFDLDDVDVPTRSFFIGDAAETLKQIAPYLIDMTLPEDAWDDPAQVPDFHRDFFKRHWKKGTGIFIRTPAAMDDVWANFRKFTKVKRSDGKVTYFRFWDPTILMHFLEASTPPELDRFFVTPHDVFCTGRPSRFTGQVTVKSAVRASGA